MKTQELTNNERVTTKIQLVKGDFDPIEANHVILSLINEKIKFHKIERLQIWEGNHSIETESLDKRIEELENEKIKTKQMIEFAKGQGTQIKIDGVLTISIINDTNV